MDSHNSAPESGHNQEHRDSAAGRYPAPKEKSQPWRDWCPELAPAQKEGSKLVITTTYHDFGTNGLGGY